VIVVEHGHGYSTYYAHNQRNAVQVGQRVKRSELIGYAGATGSATGSHVHYEIWKSDRAVNPKKFIQGRS
jgi:murein DD-endopeptidase MepM/ murein hydrolase activator NlpD